MLVSISNKEYPFQHKSINIDDALNSRSTAGFNIVDKLGQWKFKKGEPVRILEGNKENLVPRFDVWDTVNMNAQIISDYELKLVAPYADVQIMHVIRDIEPNTQYRFSHNSTEGVLLRALNANGIILTVLYSGPANNTQGFTTPANTVAIEISTKNTTAGTFYYRDMMLTKGPILQPFEPRILLFAGVIDKPSTSMFSLGNDAQLHQIDCVDYHYYVGKRLVARSYENKTVRYIVNSLFINYLADEGIIQGDIIDPGPELTECIFNYIYADEALDALAELSGADWYIDQNKMLHFFLRSERYAPTTIQENSPIKNLRFEPYAEDYRNKQYVKAGKDLTDPMTEKFKGTGQNQTFTVAFPVGKVPTVKIDNVVQTVGIRGLDENKQFYWNKSDKVISQQNELTPPTAAQTVSITYQGMMDIIIVSSDQDAIDERKEIEGGTGLHDNTIDAPGIMSRAAAFETAAAKLQRYAKVGNKVSFTTHIKGLRAGQLITINLPSMGINNVDYLIQQVRGNQMGLGGDDNRMWYDLQCVDGNASGGWADFFRKLANQNNTYVIRENAQETDILLIPLTYTKTWLQNDNPNIFSQRLPSQTLYPSTTLYNSFKDEDRVTYMVLKNVNKILLRKPILKQFYENDDPKKLVSLCTVLPFECAGEHITHIEWFGGQDAGPNGGGERIDVVQYDHDKTSLEMLQITHRDLKGW